jgi:hypothetical protein
MRTKTLIPGMKNSDEILIRFIDADVRVGMTVKQALRGFVGTNGLAVEKALRSLGAARLDPGAAGTAAVGLAGNWHGIALQVDYYTP